MSQKPSQSRRPRVVLSPECSRDNLMTLLTRAGADNLRARGQYRRLVLDQIRRRHDPAPADLAKALCEPVPDPLSIASVALTPNEQAAILGGADPKEILALLSDDRRRAAIDSARARIADDQKTLTGYVAKYYVLGDGKARRPGPKNHARRTVTDEARIVIEYYRALRREKAAHAADSRYPKNAASRAQKIISQKHGLKPRALRSILRGKLAKDY
jgi:hypothetical protein